MNNLLKDYFDKMAKNNTLGHAFLVCNTNFDNIKKDLEYIFSKYFFNNKVDIENNLDIKIIKPTEGKIIKSDILNLQEEFKTFSQISRCKIYIIDESEKMNDFASNSLLKFLEEPGKDIYAFLITTNVNKILPTIKSRCQILMIDNNNFFKIDELEKESIKNYINFIKQIENKKSDAIYLISSYFNKKEDKNNIYNFVQTIKYFYLDLLNLNIDKDIEYFYDYKTDLSEILKYNDIEKIIKKLLVLNQSENMLQYNLNLSLFLDKLIIDLGGLNE